MFWLNDFTSSTALQSSKSYCFFQSFFQIQHLFNQEVTEFFARSATEITIRVPVFFLFVLFAVQILQRKRSLQYQWRHFQYASPELPSPVCVPSPKAGQAQRKLIAAICRIHHHPLHFKELIAIKKALQPTSLLHGNRGNYFNSSITTLLAGRSIDTVFPCSLAPLNVWIITFLGSSKLL